MQQLSEHPQFYLLVTVYHAYPCFLGPGYNSILFSSDTSSRLNKTLSTPLAWWPSCSALKKEMVPRSCSRFHNLTDFDYLTKIPVTDHVNEEKHILPVMCSAV